MISKSGFFTGPDSLFQGLYRHDYFKNRHGYFQNPSISTRLGGMGPAGCSKKAVFGIVIPADNLWDGVQYAGTKETGILDHPRILRCSESRSELSETKPKLGSDYPPMRPDRHGFSENRHGYFTIPSICPRIGGMEPAMCPKKAAFGIVWTIEKSENGLQVVAELGAGKPGSPPYRRREDRTHHGHRTEWTNDEYNSETGGI